MKNITWTKLHKLMGIGGPIEAKLTLAVLLAGVAFNVAILIATVLKFCPQIEKSILLVALVSTVGFTAFSILISHRLGRGDYEKLN